MVNAFPENNIEHLNLKLLNLTLPAYCPSIHAKINGATIVASLSTINFGVFMSSLPQVIFSFGTAPE